MIGKKGLSIFIVICMVILVSGCKPSSEKSNSSDSGHTGESTPTDENGKIDPSVRWNNKFFIAASIGLGAINTEAQVERVVKNHAEAGVNMILWWTNEGLHSELFLKLCKEYGIYTILTDNETISGASENWKPIEEETFKNVVTKYADMPQVLGFVNWDEPFHEDDMYKMMRERQDWTQKYTPGKISFINLCPSYGPYSWAAGDNTIKFTDQVDTLVERVKPDVLAVDYYEFSLNGNKANLNKSLLWRDLGYLRKNGQEHDIPLWFYFQGFGDLTPEQIEFQMNAGIAYGNRWLCYWTSETSVIDERGYKSKIHSEVTSVNNRVMKYGEFLFDKKQDELYHAGISSDLDTNKYMNEMNFCNDIDKSKVFASLPDEHLILSTYLDDAGNTYVAVVNRHVTEGAKATINLKANYKTALFNSEDGSLKDVSDSSDKLEVDLTAGAMQLFKLSAI